LIHWNNVCTNSLMSQLNLEKSFHVDIASIEISKQKLVDLMNIDLLQTKQRMLNETWGKIVELVFVDHENQQLYRKVCPSIFTSFRIPKQRYQKKLTKQTSAALNQPFSEDKILRDIVGYKIEKSHPKIVLDVMMLMKTKSGQ
jgi:hypothetical protein